VNALTGRVVAPLLATSLVLLSLAVPGTSLEYDRDRVAAGESWRLVTGQLVHWSAPMMAADLGVLLVAASFVERRSRWLLILSLVISTAAVAAGVHFLETGLIRYRGSSGLASGLVVTAALDQYHQRGRSRLLAAAILATIVLKVLYELATGTAAFPGTTPLGVVVAPWVHVAGAAAGAGVWLTNRLRPLGV
jgi:rhomboid family GlyGly-CTERM serine protease